VTAANVFFDVYLTGATRPDDNRAALVRQVETRFRVDRAEAAAFISSGQRIRLRRGVDQDAAMKTIAELQALGAQVEIEPNRPSREALHSFSDLTAPGGGPPAKRALESLESLSTVEESTVDREAPTVGGSKRSDPIFSQVTTNPLARPTEKREEPSLEIPITVTAPELPPAAREVAEYRPEPPAPPARAVRPLALWLLAGAALAAGLYWLK